MFQVLIVNLFNQFMISAFQSEPYFYCMATIILKVCFFKENFELNNSELNYLIVCEHVICKLIPGDTCGFATCWVLLCPLYTNLFIFSFDGPGSSNMALIDVTMVSGFEPIVHELDMKLQSNSVEFSYYEFDEGKLTFYFEKVNTKYLFAHGPGISNSMLLHLLN